MNKQLIHYKFTDVNIWIWCFENFQILGTKTRIKSARQKQSIHSLSFSKPREPQCLQSEFQSLKLQSLRESGCSFGSQQCPPLKPAPRRVGPISRSPNRARGNEPMTIWISTSTSQSSFSATKFHWFFFRFIFYILWNLYQNM